MHLFIGLLRPTNWYNNDCTYVKIIKIKVFKPRESYVSSICCNHTKVSFYEQRFIKRLITILYFSLFIISFYTSKRRSTKSNFSVDAP